MKLNRSASILTVTAAVLAATLTGMGPASAGVGSAGPLTAASSQAASGPATPAVPATKKSNRIGRLIHTGLDAEPDSEWVFSGVSIKVKHHKKKTFGFGLYERQNNGDLSKYLVIQETKKGAALKPGFHAVEGAYTLEQDDMVQPAFGYFVGKVAKITGKVDGTTIKAKKHKWSHNTKVTVFWFDNTKVTGDTTLSSVSAYNSKGRRLDKVKVYYPGE